MQYCKNAIKIKKNNKTEHIIFSFLINIFPINFTLSSTLF